MLFPLLTLCVLSVPHTPVMEEKMSQPITVYTASYCPYCVRAKDLLTQKKLSFKEIDVTNPDDRMEMMEKSGGRKTIPQIFIGDKHIGGFDDLYALDQQGKLDDLVKG